MSVSGLSPDSKIRFLTTSTIFSGSPLSRDQISPPDQVAEAFSSSWQASGTVMKKQRMSDGRWIAIQLSAGSETVRLETLFFCRASPRLSVRLTEYSGYWKL